MQDMAELEATFQPDFEAWLLTEKYGGDVDKLRRMQRHFVNQERKSETREQARRGLLLPQYMYEYARQLEAQDAA